MHHPWRVCLVLTIMIAACYAATPVELTGTGTISSPNYPSNYANNLDLAWLIISTADLVRLDFDSFNTENNAQKIDALSIYDGYNSSYPLLKYLYGNYMANPPRGLTTSQPYMYLEFTSDVSVNFKGFTGTYQSLNRCPATPVALTGNSGVFTSPFFPDNYYDNCDCKWLITSTNDILSIQFTFINTEYIPPNTYDPIYLYDYANDTRVGIAGFWGTYDRPSDYTVTSSQQYVLVQFTSNEAVALEGFNATYTSMARDTCSSPVELTGTTGTVSSPYYPFFYSNNLDCQWRITSTLDAVSIQFSLLITEYQMDYVYTYDEYGVGSQYIIAYFYGYWDPASSTIPTVTSVQQVMVVRLTSNEEWTNRGFSATYTSIASQSCPSSPVPLTGDSGSFSSPYYPNFYYNNAVCKWLIASTKDIVRLDFTYLSTEEDIDEVSVYDNDDITQYRIDTYSGYYDNPPTGIRSSQKYMVVLLISNQELADLGFQATYTSETIVCDVIDVDSNTVTLSSPNYPANYPNNNCTEWRILSANEIVILLFNNFNLEENFDFVYIYDGYNNTDNNLVARLTGTFNESEGGFGTTQPYMLVRFISDESVRRTGFTATIISTSSQQCSATPLLLTDYNGTITSPYYPGQYPDDAYCTWQILSTEEVVNINILHLNLEDGVDYLNLYDGKNTSSIQYASFTGLLPSDSTNYRTSQRYAFVEFISSQEIHYQGFELVYTSLTVCVSSPVDLASVDTGTFSSLNYPSNYPDEYCNRWRIQSTKYIVILNFNHFDTEVDYDFVYIYDGYDNTENNQIASLTGLLDPPPRGIRSTQQYMVVRFISDRSENKAGFEATYVSATNETDVLTTMPAENPGTMPFEYSTAADEVTPFDVTTANIAGISTTGSGGIETDELRGILCLRRAYRRRRRSFCVPWLCRRVSAFHRRHRRRCGKFRIQFYKIRVYKA